MVSLSVWDACRKSGMLVGKATGVGRYNDQSIS